MSQILIPYCDVPLEYDKDFYHDYGIFVKPIDYPLSSRKIESLLEIAEMQKFFQCNPVKFIDIMFNIELLDMQALAVQKTWICPNSLLVCTRGFGKALALDTRIPTINGSRKISDIKVGDYVYDEERRLTRVTNTSEIFVGHRCFRIVFEDGEVITADEDHLWRICSDNDIYFDQNTRWIHENISKCNLYVPTAKNSGWSSYKKKILYVNETDSVPTKCLMVDSPNHLFLCGNRDTVTHNSTVIDLELMSKGMLFNNYWCYIASGSGSQAENTFNTLEKLANDNIDTFAGSTGRVFKNEVEIKNAAGDGFSHSSNGFNYSLYNGSMTATLNSNIDAKRGFFQSRRVSALFYYSNILGERIMIKIKNYTTEELNYIKKNYNYMTVKQLSEKLDKPYNSVNNAVRKMGLIKQKHNKWTDSEIAFLKENYIEMTSEEISKHVDHSIDAINAMRDRLGLIRNKTWTEEEIEYLKENFETTLYCDISKKLGRTEGAIRAKCFELDLFKKTPWSEDELEFVKRNYMEMKTRDIAMQLNRTMNSIELKAARMGMKKYPYTCDYHYFDEIDTEEKAYWLGFLTADGWISRNEENNAGAIGIELQYGDINHLKKFNKSIGGNYQITDRWRPCSLSESNKEHHTCVIRIFSITMYESLVKKGFTNNKTYNFKIPYIKPDLIRHYMRGYFDGDGCFTFTNKSFHINFITASEALRNDLIEILKKKKYSPIEETYVDDFNTTMYKVHLYKNLERLDFLAWIYENCSIYLDRKYKKYLKVKECYNNTESLAS